MTDRSAVHKIAVIGAGAWGTALAAVAARSAGQVAIWAREAPVVDAINHDHANPDFLPDVPLDPKILASGDLGAVLADAALGLVVVPTQHIRACLPALRAAWPSGAPLVVCAKGIEQDSGDLPTEIIAEAGIDAPVAVLSGPTFAAEVARGLPTAITLAATDHTEAERAAALIGHNMFRPYLSDDPIGVQVGGAVKNVIAIACGIVAGRKLGENARAALITRGLAEIGRLAAALGGRTETMMGLSGLGDLTLTCGSLQSRNMSLGFQLADGRTLDEIMASRRSVAEGVWTARSVAALASARGIDMPICQAVNAILHHGAAVDDAIEALLSRPFTSE